MPDPLLYNFPDIVKHQHITGQMLDIRVKEHAGQHAIKISSFNDILNTESTYII